MCVGFCVQVAEGERYERECQVVLQVSQRDTEQAREDVAGKVAAVTLARDRLRAREVAVVEAVREEAKADLAVQTQEAAEIAAEERCREAPKRVSNTRQPQCY